MRTKIFTLLAASAISLSAIGQKQQLLSVDDNYSRIDYRYNSDNLLDSIHLMYPGFRLHYDLYEYDANNNVVKMKGYNENNTFDGYNYQYYYAFDYDDANRVTKRTAYNDFEVTGTFTMTGWTEYSYNERGLLASASVMQSDWYDDFFKSMETKYTYNANGEIDVVDIEGLDFTSGEWTSQGKQKYEYDAKGRLLNIIEYYYTLDGALAEGASTRYEYDDAGNVLVKKYSQRNEYGGYADQTEDRYKYDMSVPASDVVYPNDIDAPDYVMATAKNKILNQAWYAHGEDSGEFQLVSTYEFIYSDPTSIHSALMQGSTERLAVIDRMGTRLFADTSAGVVAIYDMQGRLAQGWHVGDGDIDIAAMPHGMYVLKIGGKSMKFRK